jgi:hypothetical protein
MNPANLQIEGLCIALSHLLDALRIKGVLSRDEIDELLARADDTALADKARNEQLSDPHIEAIRFAARFLRMANARTAQGGSVVFSELAEEVARRKDAAGRGVPPTSDIGDPAAAEAHRAGIGPEGFTREAGPEAMRDPPRDWDEADERSDESFPASDPAAKY